MISLTNYGNWMWTDDHTITPREIEWWATQDTTGEIVYLRDQRLYQEDLNGLRTLDEAGKLYFYSGPGEHMFYDPSYVTTYLIPLMANETPAPSEY